MVSLHDAADVTHAGGMRATRAFPTRMHSHLDPFVLFERFHIGADQGSPATAHAGFEICTYMLEGGMAHDDSLDNAGTARAGEAMRISAGRGSSTRSSRRTAPYRPPAVAQSFPRTQRDRAVVRGRDG